MPHLRPRVITQRDVDLAKTREADELARKTDPKILHDRLLAAIGNNSHAEAAAVCDDIFHKPGDFEFEWKYLKAAALKGNKDIVRLLLSWGAKVDEQDAVNLPLSPGANGMQALRILNDCGAFRQKLPLPTPDNNGPAQEPPTAPEKKKPEKPVNAQMANIPSEWLYVLQILHEMGSTDAVIAGGALRDTFNARAVRDVDIFLANPVTGFFQEKKQKKFLEALFSKAGLEICDQIVGYGDYGGPITGKFAKPKSNELVTRDYGSVFKSPTSSWRVVAGPQKTEYNIVFIDKTLAEDLRKKRVGELLRAFDIGLCQIGTDGKKIITTGLYDSDINTKQVEVWHENPCSLEHLQRVIEKYKDYKVGAEAKKILNKPRPRVVESWGS